MSGSANAQKVEILFFFSTPPGYPYFDAPLEWKESQTAIQNAKYGHQINLIAIPAATINDLIEKINQYNPPCVHITGHGELDKIILQDLNRKARLVEKGFLKGLLSGKKDIIKLVFLNVCDSCQQAQEMSEYIDCVIGIEGKINDASGRLFSKTFYGSLAEGNSLAHAFEEAHSQLSQERDFDVKPYYRSGIDPASVYLVPLSDPDDLPINITINITINILSIDELKNLVCKLNSCNCIKNNKQGVINKLLPALQERIEEKKDLFSWTDDLLVKCDEIEGGFQSLLAAVSFFDGETRAYKALKDYVVELNSKYSSN